MTRRYAPRYEPVTDTRNGRNARFTRDARAKEIYNLYTYTGGLAPQGPNPLRHTPSLELRARRANATKVVQCKSQPKDPA